MATLTRDEARRRAETIIVDSYRVELDLTGTAEGGFRSRSSVRFRCAKPDKGTFVELTGECLDATLNGVRLPEPAFRDGRIELTERVGLAGTNELVVDARMTYSSTGEGLHRFVDPADDEVYLYAQSFLDNAQRIFACFDQFDLKAPITLTVVASAEWRVIANNDPVTEPTEEAVPAGAGVKRWEFAPTQPIPPYLFGLCAGRYHSIEGEHDGIRLGLHCRRSLATFLDRDADEILGITKNAFDWYHRTFERRYPFDGTYDQVFVPEFNASAMENPGCVTFRDEHLFRSAVTEQEHEERAITICHEMAHMWFGDLVTMRWGDDLWLNESFAEYLGQRVAIEAAGFPDGLAGMTGGRKLRSYLEDQRPSTHPVAGDVPDNAHVLSNFDMISYAKGASVLRQLVALLSDEVFFAGVNLHFDRHAYGNASMVDLIAALSEVSGRSLTEWADAWISEAQVNTLSAKARIAPDDTYETVYIEQEAPESHPVLRPHSISIGLYSFVEGAEPARLERVGHIPAELTTTRALTAVPELVGVRRPDLLLVNDGDLSYTKIRLADTEIARLGELVAAMPDRLGRALLYTAALTMLRDGELSTEDYVDMVTKAITIETNPGTLALTVLRWARVYAVDRYLSPLRRPAALTAIASALREVFERPDGSAGLTLAAVRGFVGSAIDDGDLGTIESWLDGGELPAGVALDTDLRWMLLRRLVITGRARKDAIDAERNRDSTAFGAIRAVELGAALPDAAAKAAAWRALMTDETLTNRQLTAIAEGFWQPEHRELTATYEPRYFRDILAFADRATPWMINKIGALAFPRFAVDTETIALASEFAESDRLPPGLRRAAADQTYELKLAWTVRQRG